MLKVDKRMHFLVIGCGSIGKRHIRNLKKLGYRVSGCEKNRRRAKGLKKAYKIEVFRNLREAFANKYDAAFICTPTSLHIPIAIEAAKRGINLFIEKPLSHNLEGIEKLQLVVQKKHLVVLVGCNTRFSPIFQAARKLIVSGKIGKVLSVRIECGFYLPFWHPGEDYTNSYSANRHLGGGVILDDIHEIDSLYWMFGPVKEVFCFADKVSNLRINTEDFAEIFLRFNSEVIAQIHLDYLQRTYRRIYEFIGEKGVVLADFMAKKIKLYSQKSGQLKIFEGKRYADRETMFIEEIQHFLNCIRQRRNSINGIASAKNILKIALACHKSTGKKEVVFL
jgi:predicted dehydrogenase